MCPIWGIIVFTVYDECAASAKQQHVCQYISSLAV